MCGRYNIITDAEALVEFFEVAIFDLEDFQNNYNAAPTQLLPVVRQTDAGRELCALRWGLVPFWAKDTKIGYKTINARSETLASKPAFRAAFKKRRCLVPASGYFEWQQANGKQPYNICLEDRGLFAFAGLWEQWEREKETLETFTIATTDASEQVRQIHDRMPVIIPKTDYSTWLESDDPDALQALLKPHEIAGLMSYPVSKRVSNARNNDASVVDPA